MSDFFVFNDPAVFGLVEAALGGGDGELVDNNVGHWLVILRHGVERHDVVGVGADEATEKTSSRIGNGGWVINGEVKTAVVVGDLDGEGGTVLDVDLDRLVAHVVVLVDNEVNIAVGLDACERIWLRWGLGSDAGVVDTVEVESEVGAFGRREVDGGHSGLVVLLVFGRVSGDGEGGRRIDEEVHLGVWAWGVVEADGLLAFGVDHEMGITIGVVVLPALGVVIIAIVSSLLRYI